MDDDDPIVLPLEDTLDLHAFRPSEVGSLVPEWLAACREAGLLDVRVVHGKGTGTLRAGVLALLERSPLVRTMRADGNWGGINLQLWDPATDAARARAVLLHCPRLVAILREDAWIAGDPVRDRVWLALHRRPGEPDGDALTTTLDPGAFPETATCVAVRGAGLEIHAPHGLADLVGMVVRPTPGVAPEAFRARLATMRWRQRFPWVRVERG